MEGLTNGHGALGAGRRKQNGEQVVGERSVVDGGGMRSASQARDAMRSRWLESCVAELRQGAGRLPVARRGGCTVFGPTADRGRTRSCDARNELSKAVRRIVSSAPEEATPGSARTWGLTRARCGRGHAAGFTRSGIANPAEQARGSGGPWRLRPLA